MKERSIILSGDEVRGVIDGSVTQLRRPVSEKLWPLLDQIAAYNGKPTWQCLDFDVKCPWDVERFWVKETWAPHPQDPTTIFYRATVDTEPGIRVWDGPWISPARMPRRASRLTLDNTGVTVELNFTRWDWVIEIGRLK